MISPSFHYNATANRHTAPHFWDLHKDTTVFGIFVNYAADSWAADPIDVRVALYG